MRNENIIEGSSCNNRTQSDKMGIQNGDLEGCLQKRCLDICRGSKMKRKIQNQLEWKSEVVKKDLE